MSKILVIINLFTYSNDIFGLPKNYIYNLNLLIMEICFFNPNNK